MVVSLTTSRGGKYSPTVLLALSAKRRIGFSRECRIRYRSLPFNPLTPSSIAVLGAGSLPPERGIFATPSLRQRLGSSRRVRSARAGSRVGNPGVGCVKMPVPASPPVGDGECLPTAPAGFDGHASLCPSYVLYLYPLTQPLGWAKQAPVRVAQGLGCPAEVPEPRLFDQDAPSETCPSTF